MSAKASAGRPLVRRRGPWSRISPLWLLLFLAVWWVLAGDEPGAWGAGLVAILVGAALHKALGGRPLPRIRIRGLLSFAPYFLVQSLRGGVDVSRRAMDPALPLRPDLLSYRMSLPPGPGRVFFASVISLLPGTLSARMRGDGLRVHLLTRDAGAEERLRELERRVARLFGTEGPEEASRDGAERRPW